MTATVNTEPRTLILCLIALHEKDRKVKMRGVIVTLLSEPLYLLQENDRAVEMCGVSATRTPKPYNLPQEKDRAVEMRGVTATLDKAKEQISDATWREGLALERVRQLRREVEALGAALADMRAQRGGAGANPGAGNPGVTGALAGLVPGSAGLLGGGFDRGRLLVSFAHTSNPPYPAALCVRAATA